MLTMIILLPGGMSAMGGRSKSNTTRMLLLRPLWEPILNSSPNAFDGSALHGEATLLVYSPIEPSGAVSPGASTPST